MVKKLGFWYGGHDLIRPYVDLNKGTIPVKTQEDKQMAGSNSFRVLTLVFSINFLIYPKEFLFLLSRTAVKNRGRIKASHFCSLHVSKQKM